MSVCRTSKAVTSIRLWHSVNSVLFSSITLSKAPSSQYALYFVSDFNLSQSCEEMIERQGH